MPSPRKAAAVAAIALVVFAGLVAAACGDDDSTNTPATTPTTAASQPTTVPTTAPTSPPTVAPTPTTAVAATIKTGTGGSLGTVLTDANGLTLYTFKNDDASPGKSVCNGNCASTWPPLEASGTPVAASGITGEVTVITRDDGTKQIAYKGHPLYRFAPDKAPGDVNGQGVGNVWFVAAP